MEKIVNACMLTLARESRGMSQADLAESINVTQGKVSKYENEMLLVSEEDLAKVANVLNYTEELFFQKDKVYGLGSSFLFHRQRKVVPMLLQKKIQAEVNILRMQVDRLLRVVDVEAENHFEPIDIDLHNGDAAKIARLTRAAWRLPLGPVANITAAIESAGGIVLQCSFDVKQIDAAHLWLPGLPPLFFVNRDMPGDRLRWTLAHEIGHAVMHRNPTGDVEAQANTFASEFLMPEEEIAHHLDGMTLEKAAMLKQRWKVSMAAIIYRAKDLGRITAGRFKSLYASLGAQGYRAVEPFPLPVEEPQLAKKLVDIHRGELGYSDFDLAKLLFSPDPQYFGKHRHPSILKFDNRPFFAFFGTKEPSKPFSIKAKRDSEIC